MATRLNPIRIRFLVPLFLALVVALAACSTTEFTLGSDAVLPDGTAETSGSADSTAELKAEVCPTGLQDGVLVLDVSGTCLALPAVTSSGTERPSRAVVAVHGVGRNAGSMFRSVVRAEPAALEGSVLVIAPKFYSDKDAEPALLVPGVPQPVWPGNDWTEGDESLPFGTAAEQVSSYEVIDALVSWLLATEPGLTDIVVYGHSAGGQFVNRYAAGTRVVEQATERGVHMRFVVANPSSYLYFDQLRPTATDPLTLAQPSAAMVAECPRFDRYKYGLERRNPYMNATDASALEANYFARDVVHLIGADDSDPSGENLAMDCGAQMQGSNRLERALAYHNYRYTVGAPAEHHTAILPGVGHESSSVTTAACGVAFLFGTDQDGCRTLPADVVASAAVSALAGR